MKVYFPALRSFVVFILSSSENMIERKEKLKREVLNAMESVDGKKFNPFPGDSEFAKYEVHIDEESDLSKNVPDAVAFSVIIEPEETDWTLDSEKWEELNGGYRKISDDYLSLILESAGKSIPRKEKWVEVVLRESIFYMAGFEDENDILSFAKENLYSDEDVMPREDRPAMKVYDNSIFIHPSLSPIEKEDKDGNWLFYDEKQSYFLSPYNPKSEKPEYVSRVRMSFETHIARILSSYAKLKQFERQRSELDQIVSKKSKDIYKQMYEVDKKFRIRDKKEEKGFLARYRKNKNDYDIINEKTGVFFDDIMDLSSYIYSGTVDRNNIKKNIGYVRSQFKNLKASPSAGFPYLPDVWISRFEVILDYYGAIESEMEQIKNHLDYMVSRLSLIYDELQRDQEEINTVFIAFFTVIMGLFAAVDGFFTISEKYSGTKFMIIYGGLMSFVFLVTIGVSFFIVSKRHSRSKDPPSTKKERKSSQVKSKKNKHIK